MTHEELNQAYAEQLASRRAANCYDIHEAAQAIALQLGLDEDRTEKLRDDMGQAAFDGALTVRSPGGHDQYAPTSPPKTNYGFDSLTTPDDVNQWATERRFTWRWLSEPQASTPSPAPVVAKGASVFRHSTKARRDTLTPVIELAQSTCRNPQDTAEVWAALLVLAEQKHPPLRGATEDGLQYLKGGIAANFNRDALRKRLDR